VPRFQRIETKVVRLEVRLPPRGQDSHGTPDRVPVCRRRASSEKPAPSQQRETGAEPAARNLRSHFAVSGRIGAHSRRFSISSLMSRPRSPKTRTF